MTTRVTFTLDPTISHQAKAVARARKQSLSSLVQSLLAREVGGTTPVRKTTFSARWAGKMTLRDGSDARMRRLKAKHAF